MSSSFALRTQQATSRREVAAWAIVVALTQWFLLLGIPIAVALAFTRLRHNPPLSRWGLVALAGVILVVQLFGLLSYGAVSGHVGPAHRVG